MQPYPALSEIQDSEKDPFKAFLSDSLESCLKTVNAQSGSIFLIDKKNKDRLFLEVARNREGKIFDNVKLRLGERIVGKVARDRKPLFISDLDREKEFESMPRYLHYTSKSLLSVPLEHAHELIGVVNITDKMSGAAFSHTDFSKVLSIARDLGVATDMLKGYLERLRKVNLSLLMQLNDLKGAVARANKYCTLGKFSGDILHAINGPLDGIIRYINLAYHQLENETSGKRYLKNAAEGLSRLTRVVNSIATLKRMIPDEPTTVDVTRELNNCITAFNNDFKLRHINFQEFLLPCALLVPDFGLKLVFTGIMQNAAEAMKQGGMVNIYSQVQSGCLEIRFTDSGCGIPESLLKKVFEPFFTTKADDGALGMGLTVAHEIIQKYKGSIFIENIPAGGTSVTVSVPVAANSLHDNE
ncbi:MAG: HAMP domain-containing sensor histidine kinase [Candidatus Omnitrophota bacterium]